MQAIVLAAGLSRRMGKQKLLLPWKGSTLLGSVLACLLEAGLGPVFCVVSPDTERALRGVSGPVRPILNETPERGQATSLRLGLEAVDPAPFCLTVGDLPRLEARDVAALRERYEDRGPGLTGAVPFRDGTFGHPMFFDFLWRDRLLEAEGDRGGRGILARRQGELLLLRGADAFFEDLDTPKDYQALCAQGVVLHSNPSP